MDSVALYLSRDYTLSIIQAVKDAKLKCEGDGRRVMAKQYSDIERILREQHDIAHSINQNIKRNKGEYRLDN
jgi:hypothetical protein